MSLVIPRCDSCGHSAFPPRALCPTCGSREWHDENVEGGVIEGITQNAEVNVAEVRTHAGPVVVARMAGAEPVGTVVTLEMSNDAVTARSIG
jgi:uncharacterized OB-fold protein